jgi:hypothetical protein
MSTASLKQKVGLVKYIVTAQRGYGRRVGLMCNTLIIENSDVVIAAWNFTSTETMYSIQKAKALKKKLIIVDTNTGEVSTPA